MSLTEFSVSDAHVALQQVVHLPGGPLFKLGLLAGAKGKAQCRGVIGKIHWRSRSKYGNGDSV